MWLLGPFCEILQYSILFGILGGFIQKDNGIIYGFSTFAWFPIIVYIIGNYIYDIVNNLFVDII